MGTKNVTKNGTKKGTNHNQKTLEDEASVKGARPPNQRVNLAAHHPAMPNAPHFEAWMTPHTSIDNYMGNPSRFIDIYVCVSGAASSLYISTLSYRTFWEHVRLWSIGDTYFPGGKCSSYSMEPYS